MEKSSYDADEIKRKCEEIYCDLESQIMYLEEHLKNYDPLIEKLNMQPELHSEFRGRIRLKPRGITDYERCGFIWPFHGKTIKESRYWLIENKIKLQKTILEKEIEKEKKVEIGVSKKNNKTNLISNGIIYKQDVLNVNEQELHDLLLKLQEKAYVDKLSVDSYKEIINDNFSSNLLHCSNDIKNKINWKKTWCVLKYTCELLQKYNVIGTEKTDKAFIAAHFLFRDNLKSEEQVKNGYEHCKLKDQDKKSLDEIFDGLFEKYL